MEIGIVYDVARFEEKQLLQAARNMGHRITPVYVPDSTFWITKNNGVGFNLAFQRCVSYYRALSSSIALESSGVYMVNSSSVIRDCEDKLLTTARLASKGIPTPDTAVVFKREKAVEASEMLGYPVVVKPIYGSWGRMMAKASDRETLLDIIEMRENMPSPYLKVHYLQQYVKKPNRDIRAYYVWGDVPVAIYRVSNSWKTNTALGGKAIPCTVTDEIREAVVKASEAIGGGVLGVDLLEDPERGLLVCEVNAVVEFKNTVRVTGYDLASKIVEETVKVFKR